MLEPEAVIGEGVRGRGVVDRFCLTRDLGGGPADDGKRSPALDVAAGGRRLLERGGVWGGEWVKYYP